MRALALVLLALPAAALAGAALAGAVAPFSIVSPAFADFGYIPQEYSCDGAGRSPALVVAGSPSGTASVALVANDPDAPVPVIVLARNFTHWTVWNAPVDATFPAGSPPPGAVEGLSSAGSVGWTPPCPPPGSPPHRYQFLAFALDATLDLERGARRSELESAMRGHVLAKATLTGCYMRLVASLPGCPPTTPASP